MIAITIPPPTKRQERYTHLCALLKVPAPARPDGYTAADWDAQRASEYAAEDARRDRAGQQTAA